jgi:hypothetical protein
MLRQRPTEPIAAREPSAIVDRDLDLGLRAREPEVHHANATLVSNHDVVGLEVAMDQPRGMGCRHAAPGREHHVEHLSPATLVLACPRAERAAIHELHGQPHPAVVLADVVHGHDLGMRELGERLGLSQQTRATVGGHRLTARIGQQHLDRDLAIELGVVRGIDHAHATRAQLREHDIATDHVAAAELPARTDGSHFGRAGQRVVVGVGRRGQGVLDRLGHSACAGC